MDNSVNRPPVHPAQNLPDSAYQLYRDLPARFTLAEILELAEGRRIGVSETAGYLLRFHQDHLVFADGAWFVKATQATN